jgi:hypothetical protein
VKAATERPVAVDLQAVIALSLQDVIQLANEKRIDVGLSASATAMVMGDQNEIRILFKNLLDNAIRYTPSGGSVDIALDRGRASCPRGQRYRSGHSGGSARPALGYPSCGQLPIAARQPLASTTAPMEVG